MRLLTTNRHNSFDYSTTRQRVIRFIHDALPTLVQRDCRVRHKFISAFGFNCARALRELCHHMKMSARPHPMKRHALAARCSVYPRITMHNMISARLPHTRDRDASATAPCAERDWTLYRRMLRIVCVFPQERSVNLD